MLNSRFFKDRFKVNLTECEKLGVYRVCSKSWCLTKWCLIAVPNLENVNSAQSTWAGSDGAHAALCCWGSNSQIRFPDMISVSGFASTNIRQAYVYVYFFHHLDTWCS